MHSKQSSSRLAVVTLCLALFGAAWATSAVADPISPELQAKIDKHKKRLVEWAANPVVLNAVKESNAKGGIAGMSNAKWDELSDKDPVIAGIMNSAAGKLVHQWEGESKEIGKVYVRDEKGNIVAASSKPLLYNAANRPAITGVMKGEVWQQNEVKPDPSTQRKSVNISAPIKDGGKVVGVVNATVEAQ